MTVSPILPSINKGRVLIVGATGFIGQFVGKASLAAGHPTYVLVRRGPESPSKAAIVRAFQDKGAIAIHVSALLLLLLYIIITR